MAPQVGIVMSCRSEWETMRAASEILTDFDISHEQCVLAPYAVERILKQISDFEAQGFRILIVSGAAYLPGLLAAHTTLPVLGVPIPSRSFRGLDSLVAMVQMPRGLPVGTLAIGEAGAANAALFAVSILALTDRTIRERLQAFRERQTRSVLDDRLP
ncbi:MAG: 5-(carboxyamino)imidazole ribonucleotide mutase [Nitrospirae bacterium]|nr:MAG: 5-(carboxyamino)imidazole ribonucleotide mutase [Nitrospirota bacterium]